MWYSNSKSNQSSAFTRLSAAGLSRLREHMMNGPYAMMSAHRGIPQTELDRHENNLRQQALKRLLSNSGLSWVDTKGAWSEPLPEGGKNWINENSVFVPGIAEDQAREIARYFNQQAVLLGNQGKYRVEGLEGDSPTSLLEGNIDDHLHLLQPQDDADLYSKVGNKRWVLNPMENKETDQRLSAVKDDALVAYVCSTPIPMVPLSGVIKLSKAKALPMGALAAFVFVDPA